MTPYVKHKRNIQCAILEIPKAMKKYDFYSVAFSLDFFIRNENFIPK